MPAGCGGLRRSDSDAAMVACRENITSSIAARTWAPASTDLVICQAIAGANIYPRLLRPGPRQRRRARSRPRQAIDQVRKQPRSNAMLGVDIDYQAIGETRGSMRLVSVTVRLALLAPPPRGWGRHRRPLSASRLPPRPPAPATATISSIRMTSRVCTNCCRCSLSGSAFDRLDLDETNARMPTPGGPPIRSSTPSTACGPTASPACKRAAPPGRERRSMSSTARSRKVTSPAAQGPSAWRCSHACVRLVGAPVPDADRAHRAGNAPGGAAVSVAEGTVSTSREK